MFDITEREITYKGRVIAQFVPMPLGVLREVENKLRDFTTADDFDDEHEEALKAEYDEGFDNGRTEAENDAANALDDEREKIRDEGFALGHAQGIKDGQNATDAARVELLLLALQDIHNKLLPIGLGIETASSEGWTQRRPAKISEAKAAAKSCCADARMAINQYRGE